MSIAEHRDWTRIKREQRGECISQGVCIYVVINISAVIYGSDIESRESWIKSEEILTSFMKRNLETYILVEHTGHLFLFHFPAASAVEQKAGRER
jgi:hypothetical protein